MPPRPKLAAVAAALLVLATSPHTPADDDASRPRHAALVELRRPAAAPEIAAIERLGAHVSRVDGAPLVFGAFVAAELDDAAARRLAASPLVVRVRRDAPARAPLPLDHSAQLVRLADARGARPALDLLTGSGVVIADVDSAIDPFHPTFFRGDAGYFDWIDVDKDGAFTPGVDAIDLDGDGRVGPGEVGLVLSAALVDAQGHDTGARTPSFDPSVDWIYLDTNGNGRRDFGPPEWSDADAAFGEPLFVPDDVDKNGRVDVGERFVRLGTSKLRSVYVHVDSGATPDHVYTRGVDLTSVPVDVSHGALYGYPDALHATGAATILAGDVPLVARRFVGMAPDADLVVAWDAASGLPIAGATWALAQAPDVALYEVAAWTGVPLDGSDAISALVDAAPGVSHACPAGDEASADKHAHASIAAAASASLPLDLPATAKAGTATIDALEITLGVRGGAAATATLSSPAGDAIDLTISSSGSLAGGASYAVTSATSARGTLLLDVLVKGDASHALPIGAWTVSIRAAAAALTLDGYVSDDRSGAAVGAAWDASVRSDASTVAAPAVGDHCVAVGAHPDHVAAAGEPWFDVDYGGYDVASGAMESQGEVRAYSARGPRADGARKPDVLAPDNPWVAAPYLADSQSPYGAYHVFGGTSGAAPHVAGVLALLAQAGLRGDAAKVALTSNAAHDATTGAVWNASYGFGRLDAAAALGAGPTGSPPTVRVAASNDSRSSATRSSSCRPSRPAAARKASR